jgi:hypothetical protein
VQDLIIVLAAEGRSSTEHDKHDNAHGPVVALSCVRPLEDLWGDVVGCAIRSRH